MRVLSIYRIGNDEPFGSGVEARSYYDKDFVYRVGDVVRCREAFADGVVGVVVHPVIARMTDGFIEFH
ncbi:MAG: hypothetical protein J6X18_02675 [Bacteroidales bacterium]|nr:hypothetical protein [Bacteroidales bacterium]